MLDDIWLYDTTNYDITDITAKDIAIAVACIAIFVAIDKIIEKKTTN